MLKITLLFESDIFGIYKQEVETASDDFKCNFKTEQMINNWLDIFSYALFGDKKEHNICNGSLIFLCENSYNSFDANSNRLKFSYEYKYELIQLYIKYLNMIHITNRNRTFKIIVEQI